MTKLKFPTPLFLGFLQATAIFSYILTFSYIIISTEKTIDTLVPSFLAPTLFLTLFVSSALITSSMAFYHPIVLFFIKNKKKRAMHIIIATAGFLVFYALSVVSLLMYISTI